ncbi:DUF4183 domain-containing protein [Neobacillus sp. NPDC093127]|uniref:DUF4183 domain-containing protein n=1 Tax=Neobacillus sp. NPDC093127 TaxID=3364296 RepID=UPI00382FE3AB
MTNRKKKLKKELEEWQELKNSMKVKIECKPHIEVNPTIIGCSPITPSDVYIIPIVNRYFYISKEDIQLTNGTVIPSTLFSGDDGNLVKEFTIFNPNGYSNLYINGVMQEGKLYGISLDSISFRPVAQTIFAGTPIIVESVGFIWKQIGQNG